MLIGVSSAGGNLPASGKVVVGPRPVETEKVRGVERPADPYRLINDPPRPAVEQQAEIRSDSPAHVVDQVDERFFVQKGVEFVRPETGTPRFLRFLDDPFRRVSLCTPPANRNAVAKAIDMPMNRLASGLGREIPQCDVDTGAHSGRHPSVHFVERQPYPFAIDGISIDEDGGRLGYIGLGDRSRNSGTATFQARVGQNAQQTGGLVYDYS